MVIHSSETRSITGFVGIKKIFHAYPDVAHTAISPRVHDHPATVWLSIP